MPNLSSQCSTEEGEELYSIRANGEQQPASGNLAQLPPIQASGSKTGSSIFTIFSYNQLERVHFLLQLANLLPHR
jgi:hypothetical protein